MRREIMRHSYSGIIYLGFGAWVWSYAPHEVTNGGRILVGMAIGQFVVGLLSFWNRRKRYPSALYLRDEG